VHKILSSRRLKGAIRAWHLGTVATSLPHTAKETERVEIFLRSEYSFRYSRILVTYGTKSYIIVFTTAQIWSPPWARWIQSTLHPTLFL